MLAATAFGPVQPVGRSAAPVTAIALPPRAGTWQYQLQISPQAPESSGGIDTDLCARAVGAPPGAPCVRPQLDDRDLAGLAHRDGLAAGPKNDVAQARELEPSFDFALDESCAEHDQCRDLAPFVAAGKPVFDVEYTRLSARLCAIARSDHIAMIGKRLSLFAQPWSTCPMPPPRRVGLRRVRAPRRRGSA